MNFHSNRLFCKVFWREKGEEMENKVFYVTEEEEGERIDKYLSAISDNLSRSFIQMLIKDEMVTVHQKVIMANYS